MRPQPIFEPVEYPLLAWQTHRTLRYSGPPRTAQALPEREFPLPPSRR